MHLEYQRCLGESMAMRFVLPLPFFSFGLMIVCLAGFAQSPLRTAEVEVWLTVIDDGQRKDALHQQTQPAYDQTQDAAFRLFMRQEPLRTREAILAKKTRLAKRLPGR